MSETRKNRLTIDGGQLKEDEHISTYKVIPESDTADFRKSKSSLTKSREKVSSDGAEEKLLQKEDEVKITPRVDMDAKYVVESYTNGDAKIELDANKRQFTGLTKEELMKYADDPFWVRLRWFMFILFWALWLAMLAGAIVVIVKAPKCAPPTPKTWYEKGPLVEGSLPYKDVESKLDTLEGAGVQGIFAPLCSDTYDISTSCFDELKAFVAKAKDHSIKIIVDLTANFVSKSHEWFKLSENRTGDYDSYFIWHQGTDVDPNTGKPGRPNNWISTKNISAWSWSDTRNEYYLHQFGEDEPDLNFTNPKVVREFNDVLVRLMGAGAGGIRLHNARLLLVNNHIVNASEQPFSGKGSTPGLDHTSYQYLAHSHTSDQPGLQDLFANFSQVVDQHGTNPGSGETVFTIAEDFTPGVEMFLIKHRLSSLRPISSRPLHVTDLNVDTVAAEIDKRLVNWTFLQLTASEDVGEELATFAMLLPAAPVFALHQLYQGGNSTLPNEGVKHLVGLRSDASVEHGNHSVRAAPAANGSELVLACARWKAKHTGYVSVFNPHAVEVHANLAVFNSSMPPEGLSVHYVSDENYKNTVSLSRNNVTVPAHTTVVLSYVPLAEDEATE